MKKDYFNSLEARDLRIMEDLEMNPERQAINALVETWFDVDRKFGINTKKYDDAWLNLYADYNPMTKELNVTYYIDALDASYEREYIPTDEEKKVFIDVIEQACVQRNDMNCREFYIREYLEQADEIQLVCEQNGDNYQIRNIKDNFILYSEDDSGMLKNHIGHEIEVATYGNDVCISIECIDCQEVLYSTDIEEIEMEEKQQDNQRTENQESRMSELLYKAVQYIGESECANGLYDTLHNSIGMTNDEIKAMGYSSLSEFFEDEQESEMMISQ